MSFIFYKCNMVQPRVWNVKHKNNEMHTFQINGLIVVEE